jgi:hypothetical protein
VETWLQQAGVNFVICRLIGKAFASGISTRPAYSAMVGADIFLIASTHFR